MGTKAKKKKGVVTSTYICYESYESHVEKSCTWVKNPAKGEKKRTKLKRRESKNDSSIPGRAASSLTALSYFLECTVFVTLDVSIS